MQRGARLRAAPAPGTTSAAPCPPWCTAPPPARRVRAAAGSGPPRACAARCSGSGSDGTGSASRAGAPSAGAACTRRRPRLPARLRTRSVPRGDALRVGQTRPTPKSERSRQACGAGRRRVRSDLRMAAGIAGPDTVGPKAVPAPRNVSNICCVSRGTGCSHDLSLPILWALDAGDDRCPGVG